MIVLPTGPWTDLARRLVEAKDLATAVGVTRDVLARGGVSTFDGDRVVVQAAAPAARFQVTPLETVHLAAEARRRRHAGRLTAAELAQMLEGFGWPFRGSTPGRPDRAEYPMRSQMDDALQEAARAERSTLGSQELATGRAREEAIEAERLATMTKDQELVRRIQEATLQWQKARQAVAKAPPAEKASAEAQVQQAWAVRNAVIEERRVAQQQSRDAVRERREQARAEEEAARRLDDIRELVGPDYRAGEQLMEMFETWVRQAAEDPNDPRSFTPLFLAEMARLQDPPLDLAGSRFTRPGRAPGAPVDLRGAPRSQQLRLTLLELELLAAAFYRGAVPTAAAVPAGGQIFQGAVVSARFTQDPCSEYKKSLEDLGEVMATAASEGAGKALELAVRAATDGGTADAFGKAMSAVGMAAKIGKLVSFYNNNQVTVTGSPASTHKPPEGPPLVTYTATAGVSEEDWKEYERMAGSKIDRAMRDCLSTLGMPTTSELTDLAKEAEDWLVEWRLTDGAPQHAWVTLRNNKFYLIGRLAMKLERSGPYSASARLAVDIHPEAQRTGRIVRAYVTAQASLDAAGMPSLGTLINVFKGPLGLADSLLDLCIGWYQAMNMPRAYGTIEVEYHCPKPTILVRASNPVADGGGEDGPQDCLIEAGSGR